MLTDADAEHDVVRGLDAGANDYIFKSFRPNEVRARLHIFDDSEDATFRLKFLYRAGSRRVSRQALLDEIWGYNSAAVTHTVEPISIC